MQIKHLVGSAAVILAAITGLAGGQVTARSAPSSIVPRVVSVDPPPGAELPLTGTITVYFNTAMDEIATQTAATVTDNNKAATLNDLAYQWKSDQVLMITSGTPLTKNAGYTLHFSSGAKSQGGLPLTGTIDFKLQTIGDLQVTQIIPADKAKDITADASITVIFNRPVVPLTSVEQQGAAVNPLQISPDVKGAGEWLNTSIYVFHPTAQLVGGTTYTVTIKAGLTDQTGAALTADVVDTFTTIPPELTGLGGSNLPEKDGTYPSTYPYYNSYARRVKITAFFSQTMDHATTERSFALTAKDGSKISGTFSWAKDNLSFDFTPNVLLDYGAEYKASIDPAVARSVTGAALPPAKTVNGQRDQYDITLNIFGLPQLTVSDGNYGGGGGDPLNGNTINTTDLVINFSTPMRDLDKFGSRVTFDPKLPSVTGTPSDNGMSYDYQMGLNAHTDLTITIDPMGLVDIYGTPLQVDHNSNDYKVMPDGKLQIKYTIDLQYQANLSLQTQNSDYNDYGYRNNIGLYSAYVPQTRVYSLHRNINSIDLGLWQIPASSLLNALTNSNDGIVNNNGFVPADKDYLRGWRVGVNNPAQIERYDLLTISPTGPSIPLVSSIAPSVTCDGAPTSRLHKGDSAVVTHDNPTPLNVRRAAGTTSPIVSHLPVGTKLTISDGPVCKDKYIWWQVTVRGFKFPLGWAAEGDNQYYFMSPAIGEPNPDTPVPSPTPTDVPKSPLSSATDTPLKPGAYFLSLSSTDLGGDPITQVMIIATANITLKVYPTGAMAWVTDLKSGQPIPNVPVRFAIEEAKKNDLITVQTDASGIATLSFPNPGGVYRNGLMAVLDDGTHFGVGSASFTSGIDPSNFNLNTNYYPPTQTVYMYSDRSLYKPGQPVYFKGVVRAQNYNVYTMLPNQSINVEVLNEANQSIYVKTLPITKYGTFSGQLMLDPKSALGNYRITASLTPVDPKQDPYGYHDGERDFSVAEYTPPEYQVNVSADKADIVQGDTIKVTVNSTYFFGGNVANANVSWTASTSDVSFNYTGSGSYSFYDFNEDSGPGAQGYSPFGAQLTQGEGHTDANGNFVITIPATLGKSGQSQQVTIEATVSDKSGQSVSARVPVTVHAGLFYLGATPEDYVGQAGTPSKIDVISVDWQSQPLPNTAVTVKTVERRWKNTQQVDPETGRVTWNYTVQEIPVNIGNVTTDVNGKAVYSFTPPRAGEYKVYVTSKDAKGNTVVSSTFEYVAGSDYVPWRQTNDYSMTIKLDKQKYHVGDTASILIASPFQGSATAWITVEGATVLKSDVITVNGSSVLYQLPIVANFAPDTYVSVVLMKGTDKNNPIATFRIGMAQLNVDPDAYKLNITITPDKKQAGPRETVTYKVHVTDYQGNPVKAEVGISLSDLATLSLLPDTSTPIADFFYNQQALSVLTASSLTISVDEQTQFIRSQVKGGGGGGTETGIFQVRQLFIDTPLWKPAVVTDDNGDGTVTVTLPDQLTTWRLDARAVTLPTSANNTTLVGQTTFDLISTKPLLIRPITPRFFTQGDQGSMAAVVNNNTGADQQVTITLNATGATLGSPSSQTVTIPKGEQARVDWPLTVPMDATQVGATFTASTADNQYTDAAKSEVGQGPDKTLPVIGYSVPETVTTAGQIDKNGGNVVEGIITATSTPLAGSKLDLRVDPSLASTMLATLKSTPEDICGGCAEYTVSQILSNVTAYNAIASLNVTDQPKLKADLDSRIQVGIQELYDWQRVDGGWSYYPATLYGVQGDPVTTAYALIGLATAKADGYTIDQGVLNAAAQFLRGQLQPLNNLSDTWQLNRQAIILYALARGSTGNIGATMNLYAIRTRLSLYARAELAMTLHLINPGSTDQINALISDLQSAAQISASGEFFSETYQDYWNWNSDIRTTAITLQALAEIQPTNVLIPNIVRWLMSARSSTLWQTTQDTTWSISALSEWMLVSNELKPNYSFNAQINGQSLIVSTTESVDSATTPILASIPLTRLTPGGMTPLTISRTAGNGNLYYTLHLTQYLPANQVKALSRGVTISRAYSLLSDPKHTPITQAVVGQNVQVTLTITATNYLYNVTLRDPIPAGTQGLNSQLATTKQVGTQPQLDMTNPFAYGWGWWWFDSTQFQDQQVVLSAEYLPAGTYQYTYVLETGLAGQYKVPPTTMQEQYFPEVYGRSDGSLFTLVNPAGTTSAPTTPTPSATP